jgi:hypothetical protein
MKEYCHVYCDKGIFQLRLNLLNISFFNFTERQIRKSLTRNIATLLQFNKL